MKTPNLLARIFGRSNSPMISALFANAIGEPLMVHPEMGERIIGGYLHGAVDARPSTMVLRELAPEQRNEMGVVTTAARNVAVINISGGLVNRYEGDWCDPGPLSYQELRSVFDAALADTTVEAIVLRLESPGGMVSGCFDLADHIYESRGEKPIYACVDDYAYSACYAIAAACDEIWVTRTGGTGSVGVIGYHYDQSGWNAKVGVKVTAVFAGERKNDLSPHVPISDEVKSWLQTRMDALRLLFADTVAKYRGIDAKAVLATEAGVYQGQEGIDVGFADVLGTFTDLMAHVAGGGLPRAERTAPALPDGQQRVEVDGDVLDAGAAAAEQGAADSALPAAESVAEASRPPVSESVAPTAAELTAAFEVAVRASVLPMKVRGALLVRGHADQSPADALAYAGTVRDLCFAAGLEDYAVEYIGKNTDVGTVRAQLQAARADAGPEIITAIPAAALAGTPPMSRAQDIYSRRRAAAAGQVTNPRQ